MTFKKYFTPKEANERLPLVKRIVLDILEKGKEFRQRIRKFRGRQVPKEAQDIEDEIDSLIAELEQLGCLYKDWNFDMGLVDFPSQIDGEDVMLCWRSDEPDVRWYHSLEGGYEKRIPIPEKLLTQTG